MRGDLAVLTDQTERHGLDQWRLWAATQQASISALTALGADNIDSTQLTAHIATMTTLLDTLSTAELYLYRTFFDAILGRVLIAVGRPEQPANA